VSARTRRDRAKGLKRKTEIVPVRTTFRVYSEGKSTEPEYVDALRRLPIIADRVSIDISIEASGASPMTLVEMACNAKRTGLDIDYFWCVYDVESPQPHPHLDRARDMAASNGVHLAISNPCFELWLILHFADQTAYLSTDDAVRRRGELDGSDGKHLNPDLYMPAIQPAVRRAKSLAVKHALDGTRAHDDNPSSTFSEFVEQLSLFAHQAADSEEALRS
jgi:hypothetical protein